MSWFSLGNILKTVGTSVITSTAAAVGSKLAGGSTKVTTSKGTSKPDTSKSASMVGLMSPNMDMKDAEQKDFQVANVYGGSDPWELQRRAESWFPKEQKEDK